MSNALRYPRASSEDDERARRVALRVVHALARLPVRHVLHDLLLACDHGLLAPVHVAVGLGEQQRHEVDARPCLLAPELTLLQVALPDAPEAVGADGGDAGEDGDAAGPARRQVALVADGLVAALRRQVLRKGLILLKIFNLMLLFPICFQ